ncbi:MAG: threonine synthase [Parasphingorhabdus sp.]|jgi:threonine synthase
MASGETDRMPKLFVSQPDNCPPLHIALNYGFSELSNIKYAPTVAEGTTIKNPIRLTEMVQAIRETGGTTVTLSEPEIIDATMKLSQSGLYVEPTCAHAAAGMKKLITSGTIRSDEETIVLLTGTGLKSTFFYAEQFESKSIGS